MQELINLEEQEKTELDIVEELVFNTYRKLFEEGGKVKKYIPSTREIFDRLCYDIEVKALDIIYNISEKDISEDGIATLLLKEKCVFRWGGVICENAQQVMFDNIYEEEVGFLIGEQYIEKYIEEGLRRDI